MAEKENPVNHVVSVLKQAIEQIQTIQLTIPNPTTTVRPSTSTSATPSTSLQRQESFNQAVLCDFR